MENTYHPLKKDYEPVWDGMVVFRREFYLKLRPDLGIDDYFGAEICPNWRVLLARTPIKHDKNVGAARENTAA